MTAHPKFKVEWLDRNREPTETADPTFPNGMAVDFTRGSDRPSCSVDLPYPAPRCGVYLVTCNLCGFRASVTTAGRADDPCLVKLPCNKAKH